MKSDESESQFLKDLHTRIKKKRRADVLSAAAYSSILNRIVKLKKQDSIVKRKTDDSILKKYDYIEEKKNGRFIKYLCKKNSKLRVLSSDQIYKVLLEIFMNDKKISRDTMRELVSKKYANITIEALQIFLNVQRSVKIPDPNESKLSFLAEVCNKSRGYFTVMNQGSITLNIENVYVLCYVDITNRFTHLRTLDVVSSLSIAERFLEFFGITGCPVILHSSFEGSFVLRVISHMYHKWTDCLAVAGKKYNNPNLKRVRNMIKEINTIIADRYIDNATSIEDILRSVQWEVNNNLNIGWLKSLRSDIISYALFS